MAVTSQSLESPPVGSTRAARLAYAFGIAPLVLLAAISIVTFVDGLEPGSVGFDFRGAYLRAAEEVANGESPYPSAEGTALASQSAYVYPPLLAFVLVPATFLPMGLAAALAVVAVALLLAGTLAVLAVRDWRCYAAAFLWAPTMNALHMGSASALLALAAALAWRYRDATWRPALVLGLGVATKLILWPLVVWAVVARRVWTAVYATLLAAAVTLPLWAILGFDGLERYPRVLSRLAELEAEESYSLVGAFAGLGVEGTAARVLAIAVALGLLALCVFHARRGDDPRSFVAAIAAGLAFSPIVWLHYFVLLLVPLAIFRPRFSAVWLLPLLLWLTPLNGNGEAIQPLLPTLVAAAIFALALTGTDAWAPDRAPRPEPRERVRPEPA
jgi:alpha-1,2-mannosyltransferase